MAFQRIRLLIRRSVGGRPDKALPDPRDRIDVIRGGAESELDAVVARPFRQLVEEEIDPVGSCFIHDLVESFEPFGGLARVAWIEIDRACRSSCWCMSGGFSRARVYGIIGDAGSNRTGRSSFTDGPINFRQLGVRIRAALDALTPRERTVFELRHYEGLRLRAIGEIIGTSEEAAKNCLFRATQKMRASLETFV
jgi:hypothetical protein